MLSAVGQYRDGLAEELPVSEAPDQALGAGEGEAARGDAGRATKLGRTVGEVVTENTGVAGDELHVDNAAVADSQRA